MSMLRLKPVEASVGLAAFRLSALGGRISFVPMKKPLLAVALFVTVSLWAEEKPAAPAPLAAVESLVGGTWVADVPVPAGQPPLALEAKFTRAENKHAVLFESAFVRDGKHAPYTKGFYAWNAEKQKLAIFYTDSGGSLVEGLITPEDGVLVNDLVSTEPDGKLVRIRVRLTKIGNDTFTNAIFVEKDGAMAPFVTVRYERRKE